MELGFFFPVVLPWGRFLHLLALDFVPHFNVWLLTTLYGGCSVSSNFD